jgi:hypothetical protein
MSMNLRWRDLFDVEVVWDREAKAYRATADELPEGEGYGRTVDEAVKDLEPRLVGWCEMFEALAEAKSVAPLLRAAVREFLRATSAPVYNEALDEVFGQFAVGDYPQTREMRFFLGHLESFTPRFFFHLRESVIDRFPKWSVVAQFEGAEVAITDRDLTFGPGQSVGGHFDNSHPAYVEWYQHAHQFKEQRFGPRWRQLRQLTERMPDALRGLGTSAVVVVGCYDEYDLPNAGRPVWILQSSNDPVYLNDSSSYWRSGVTLDGTILPPRGPSARVEDGPGPWLTMGLLKSVPTPSVRIVNESGDVVADAELPSLVTDRELKARYGTLD